MPMKPGVAPSVMTAQRPLRAHPRGWLLCADFSERSPSVMMGVDRHRARDSRGIFNPAPREMLPRSPWYSGAKEEASRWPQE